MKTRGFEILEEYKMAAIELPQRKTGSSAGYDIEAAAEVSLAPQQVAIIPTGLKAYMMPDEYLGIHIRSGLSIKKQLSLINGQGIIDADYYNNPDNEGHIMLAIFNHSEVPVKIEKGMRIAQGIFYKYLTADGDAPGCGEIRQGGMGSTGV